MCDFIHYGNHVFLILEKLTETRMKANISNGKIYFVNWGRKCHLSKEKKERGLKEKTR
jgi:hypothetical protein